jgi:hypothetical protein
MAKRDAEGMELGTQRDEPRRLLVQDGCEERRL